MQSVREEAVVEALGGLTHGVGFSCSLSPICMLNGASVYSYLSFKTLLEISQEK